LAKILADQPQAKQIAHIERRDNITPLRERTRSSALRNAQVSRTPPSCSPSNQSTSWRLSQEVDHFSTDRIKEHFNPTLRDAARDENNPAATIIGWPSLKPNRRVEDMLDAVDHGRLIGALRNVHNAFEAQEIRAAVLGERFEQ